MKKRPVLSDPAEEERRWSEQKTFPDRLPTGKHYRKEITIILQHGSLHVIQKRERELYRAMLQHNLHTSMLSDNFKSGIERYTSGGVVIR